MKTVVGECRPTHRALVDANLKGEEWRQNMGVELQAPLD